MPLVRLPVSVALVGRPSRRLDKLVAVYLVVTLKVPRVVLKVGGHKTVLVPVAVTLMLAVARLAYFSGRLDY